MTATGFIDDTTLYPTMNSDDLSMHDVYGADSTSESVSDDTMLDESEASFHTMSTIQSEEVAGYFRLINGFTYQSDENIPLYMPSDISSSRTDMLLHIVLRLAGGGVNTYPAADEMLRKGGIDEGGAPRVLDLLTNSGAWAYDMANMYPTATFVSLDTKPLVAHKPHPRINFEVYDLYAGIIEHDSSFDVVHMRQGISASRDLNFLLRELHRVLKPDGVILVEQNPWRAYEDISSQHVLHYSSPLGEILRLGRETFASQGVDIAIWDDLSSRLDPTHSHWENAQSDDLHKELSSTPSFQGFRDINVQMGNVPLGSWPADETSKTLGTLFRFVMGSSLSVFIATLQIGGMEEREARALVDQINLADIDRYRLYFKPQFWYARKI